MATGTAGDTGQVYGNLNVKTELRKRISYADIDTTNTAVTVGILPPRALVTGGGVWVITAFNDTNGDDLDVGVSGDDDDLFASGIDLNTGTSVSTLDDLADANRWSTSARRVTANFTTAASGNGTTGEAFVWIEYTVVPATS